MRELWERRDDIGAQLLQDIRVELAKHHADVIAVQLINLDIPSSIQNKIENTTVQFQKIDEARFDQALKNVTGETKVQEAYVLGNITIVNAEAQQIEIEWVRSAGLVTEEHGGDNGISHTTSLLSFAAAFFLSLPSLCCGRMRSPLPL